MNRLLPRVLRDLRPHRRYAIGVFVTTLFYATARIAPPFLARLLLDRTLHGKPVQLLGEAFAPDAAVLAVPALILGLAGLLAGSQYLMRYWGGLLGQRLVGDLQVRLLEHLLRLPAAVLERRSLGRQMVRFGNDMSSVRRFVSRSLPEIVRDGLTIVAIGLALVTLRLALAVPVAVAVVLYVAVSWGVWQRLQPASRELRGQRARISGIALDRLTAASAIKMVGRERKEAERLERAQDGVLAAVRRTSRLSGLLSAAAEVVVGIAIAAALGVGAHGVLVGSVSRGEMVAFYGLALMLVSPVRSLGRTVESLAIGRVAFERLYEVLDRPEEYEGRRRLRVRHGLVSISGLRSERFQFPDLRLEPGVTAIVGGSHRTATLGEMLVRLQRPASGTVAIDGADLSRVSLRSLRRTVAYVPQNPPLLKGSIRLNLRAGLRHLDDDVLRAALHAVGARWATDLGRPVGSAGRRLSPKQRWQVLCARAVLAAPAALVLDRAPVEGDDLDALLGTFKAAGIRTILLLGDRPPRCRTIHHVVSLDRERAGA